jgi:hypothetical protein
MKQETFHPNFPSSCDGLRHVFPNIHNKIQSLQPLATIPMYTFEKEGSEKRKKMEKEYLDQKQKEYQEIKAIYEKFCFVGAIFKGNAYSSVSGKITKIFISDQVGYVCYKASDEHIAQVIRDNKENGTENKPLKSGKFSLIDFLSAISNGLLNIIYVPENSKK